MLVDLGCSEIPMPDEYFVGAEKRYASACRASKESFHQFESVIALPKPLQQDFFVMIRRPRASCTWHRIVNYNCKLFCDNNGIEVTGEEILDWAYSDNGWMIGGRTIEAIYRSLDNEAKVEFRDRLPFALPELLPDKYGSDLISAIGHLEIAKVRHILDSAQAIVNHEIWTAPRRLFHALMTPRRMRPLEYAARYSDSSICLLLIESGAEVNAIGLSDYTALISAAIRGDVPIIDVLVRHGAKVDLAIHSTAIRAAVANNRFDAVKKLSALGAKMDSQVDGDTLLHVLPNNPEMAEFLVTRGVNIHSKNNDGETALDIARLNGYAALIEKLAELGLNSSSCQ